MLLCSFLVQSGFYSIQLAIFLADSSWASLDTLFFTHACSSSVLLAVFFADSSWASLDTLFFVHAFSSSNLDALFFSQSSCVAAVVRESAFVQLLVPYSAWITRCYLGNSLFLSKGKTNNTNINSQVYKVNKHTISYKNTRFKTTLLPTNTSSCWIAVDNPLSVVVLVISSTTSYSSSILGMVSVASWGSSSSKAFKTVSIYYTNTMSVIGVSWSK